MKIEQTENSVKLIPESNWEKKVLKDMRRKGKIDKMQFRDDWESDGPLELFYPEHPWEK